MTERRMVELIVKGSAPETDVEIIFVDMYRHGLTGNNIQNIIESEQMDFDTNTHEELIYFILGYATGQLHYEDRLEEFNAEEQSPDDDTTLH